MKVYVILNPQADSGKAKGKITMIKKFLYQQGHDVELKEVTNLEKDIEKAIFEYEEGGFELLLVAGGDETVRATINEIIDKDIKLGIIPVGTANVFAQEMGIPLNYRDAIGLLKKGIGVKIDVGKVALIREKSDTQKALEAIKKDKGKNFLLMAGIGFDSQVINSLSSSMKEKRPEFAYALATIQAALTYKYPLFDLEIETEAGDIIKETAFFAVISNSSFYGGPYKLVPDASMVDSLLDIVVFKEKGFIKVLKLLWALKKNKLSEQEGVKYFRAKRVKALPQLAGVGIKVQLDGDIWDELPAEFWVNSKGVEIILPEKKAKELLAQKENNKEEIQGEEKEEANLDKQEETKED